ncbi:unnamed protein product, partial [Polarella glacialis]
MCSSQLQAVGGGTSCGQGLAQAWAVRPLPQGLLFSCFGLFGTSPLCCVSVVICAVYNGKIVHPASALTDISQALRGHFVQRAEKQNDNSNTNTNTNTNNNHISVVHGGHAQLWNLRNSGFHPLL